MKTTASGLQWGVLKEGGKEAAPGANDVVEVHYTGWLTDGKKFDSSRDRGAPATFPVNGVIKGWTEALQLMTPGARWKIVIPAELGYGEGGAGEIPPNATLVFDVELLKVNRMPKFRPADPDKQQKLDNGVRFERIVVGAGRPMGPKNGAAFRYALFRSDGSLLDCSEQRNNQKLGGTLATLPLPFLKQLAPECKVGDVLRVEVPQAVWPNAQSDTVWELELTAVTDVPEFRAPDPTKLVTTQSGLQYEVIQQGEGRSPTATSTVLAKYTGWLTDGTMFDSAHARGEPSEFGLNRVIKGWTEGLQLMKEGGIYLFVVPSELGYGTRGNPPTIPANATLVFLVELVTVK